MSTVYDTVAGKYRALTVQDLAGGLTILNAQPTADSEALKWVSGYVPGPESQYKYVDVSGDDGNPGTAGLPFRTVQAAVVSAQPWDTIIVRPGSYAEVVYINNMRSGVPGKYVTLKAETQGTALLREPLVGGDLYGVIKLTGSLSYWRIEGFDIQADNGAGISTIADSSNDYRYHHIQIVGNTIHNCGDAGIGLLNGDYVLIENNTVSYCAKTSPFQVSGISCYQFRNVDMEPGYHLVIRNNTVFNNTETDATGIAQGLRSDGNGIILDDLRNTQDTFGNLAAGEYSGAVLCENNTCSNNGGAGISVFHSSNVTVRNNVCHLNNKDVQGGQISTNGGRNNLFERNFLVCSSQVNADNQCIRDIANGYNNVGNVWRNNTVFDIQNPTRMPISVEGSSNTLTAPAIAAKNLWIPAN